MISYTFAGNSISTDLLLIVYNYHLLLKCLYYVLINLFLFLFYNNMKC